MVFQAISRKLPPLSSCTPEGACRPMFATPLALYTKTPTASLHKLQASVATL